MDFSGWDGAGPTTWGVLALVNAGLAQSKRRSRLRWFLISLLLGPIATFLIVVWPYGDHLTGGTPDDIVRSASPASAEPEATLSGRLTGTPRGDAFFVVGIALLVAVLALVLSAALTGWWGLWGLAGAAFVALVVLTILYLRPRWAAGARRDDTD